METQNHLDVKEFEVTQITHELTIKRENGATFKIQKMKMENDNQITHELTFKSENGEVSGIKEEKIDAENDFNREFGAPQIAQVFIKDEFAQSIDTAAANTVLDRFYDAHNTKANDDHALMRFAGEEVLKGQDKNKNDVQRFTNKNTEIILNSTTNGNCFTNPWIKCEAVEDLKLDNDFCGITEITEEYEIKNEDDHIIKHPSTTGSHLCSHCNVTFRKKRSLDDHIIKQHPDKIAEVSCKIHTCTHCEYRTTRNDHLAHHMLKHPGADGGYKLKKCVHCNRAFRWKATLDDHIIKKHPNYTSLVSSKIHECKYCVFKTTLKNCLTKHMEKHLGAEAVYKLNRCNTTSASKKDLDDHIINHKHYICIYCNAIFRRTRSLDDHIIRKHPDCIADISSNIYACAHCKYRTTVRESLVRHMLKHPGAGGDYKPNKCIHCKGKFRHKTTLDNHIIKKHPEYIALVSSKIYECKYCIFKSTSSSHLSKHMWNHPGAKGGCELKTCIQCNVKFNSKTSLDDHIIKKHPEYIARVSSKIHECKYCAFKTTSKFHLDRHIMKHPGAEGGCQLKMCIHCKAMYRYKTSLDDHIIKKHPEYIGSVSSKIHECKYCVFKSTSKGSFTKHTRKHQGALGIS